MLLFRLAFAEAGWAVAAAGWLVPVAGWAFLKVVESVAWLASVSAGVADFNEAWLSPCLSVCAGAGAVVETASLLSTCTGAEGVTETVSWVSVFAGSEVPTETWFSDLFSTWAVATSSSAWATWPAPIAAGANKNPIASDTVATDNLRIEYFIFLSWKNIFSSFLLFR